MQAAIAGGVTSLACPPDTDPPLDEPGLVEMLKHRARSLNQAHVYPIGALTRAACRATTLTEMGELAEAGCVAFSQADVPLADTQVLLRAMQYAATFGYRVWLRPQDPHLGARRRRARRRGRDAARLAGDSGVRRNDRAGDDPRAGARDRRARAPVPAVDAPKAWRWCAPRSRKACRSPATSAIHHLHLCDIDIGWFDSACAASCRRCAATRDRDALRAGVADGTIDVICSDHTPVDDDGKQLPFGEAEPGATGLELLLPLTLKWAAEERVPLPAALARITSAPAALLGVDAGTLGVGQRRRHLRLRSGRVLEGRARARCGARARTRRSSGSKFPGGCATRSSAGRSSTSADAERSGCVARRMPCDAALRITGGST